MNEAEESNPNTPEVKDSTSEQFEPQEDLAAEANQISAVAQVVSDIPNPAEEIPENSATSERQEETTEPLQAETMEPSQKVETPVVSLPEPSETGVYQLVNGMVDKPFKAEIDLKELKIEESVLSPTFAEQSLKLGLSVIRDDNILVIEGKPSPDAKGEHALLLDYTYDQQRICRKKFILLINPDPKSLWKSIEPDESLPYRKDHTAVEQISSDDFHIIAASRRGRSHAHEGKFREDDFAVHINENGWHTVIVADGAGSAKLSREGSRLACQIALQSLKKSITELLEPKFAQLMDEFVSAKTETSEKEIKNLLYQALCGAAFASYKRLEQESAGTGNPIKDYSTTLLVSIVKKFPQGSFVAAFGIGDGAIGVYNEPNHSIELMISPDGGEFSGQTRFLTMREVIGDGNEMLRRIKFNVFDKFTMLALMTDGISDPKFGTDNNLVSPEKWRDLSMELLAEVDFRSGGKNVAQQLLEYMDFWSPGEHDDRTLAILY